METLKKFFPLSFQRTDTVANLIVGILIYIVVGIVAGAVIWLATLLGIWIPVIGAIIGWALGVVGTLVDVYCLAGIVIQILVFAKVLKD
ncbi:MAG: hypothetical protein E7649_03365 [Ruminococcaceae bacterium]|nr:hypothetical protein [Oscillospiraceae bacterium]